MSTRIKEESPAKGEEEHKINPAPSRVILTPKETADTLLICTSIAGQFSSRYRTGEAEFIAFTQSAETFSLSCPQYEKCKKTKFLYGTAQVC